MKTILQGWNFMRILRLVLGIVIAIQGIVVGETVTIILGLLFAGMSVANIGCCGTNECAVNTGGSTKIKQKILVMKKWILSNKLYFIGALVGALGGFLYYKYVGCLTGTCAITSNPFRSTIYFAFFGAILFGAFKKEKKYENLNNG